MRTYTYDGDGARESEDAPTMSTRGGFAYTQGGALVGQETALGDEGADDHLRAQAYTVHSAESCAKERHAFETEVTRSLDRTGGFASGQGGTVIRDELPEGADDHLREIAVTATGDQAHSLTSEGHDASEDGTGRGTPIVAGGITRRYGKGTDSDMTDTNVVEPSSFNWQSGGDVRHDVREGETGALHVGQTPAVHGVADEPDREAVPFDPRPDGPRYAAMGDAVTVNVAEWIGRRLMAVHLGTDPDTGEALDA